jgi:Ala-tRNA(Pro) deacylase
MNRHPITKTIENLLKQNNYWFKSFEHEPVRTSIEAAQMRPGFTLHQGAKAMIVRVKKTGAEKNYAMLVFPADQRFNTDKVKVLLKAKDVRFATEEEVLRITDGVRLGAIPPFGNLFGLDVIADETLFSNEDIVFNAGDNSFSIAMKSKDYKALAKPQIGQII